MNDPKKNKLTLWLESLRKYKLLKPLIDLFFKYREIIMYLIFGVLTTAVDFLVSYILCKIFHVDNEASTFIEMTLLTIANFVGWVAAVVTAYITNKIWVFDSKSFETRIIIKEFINFVGGRIASFLIQTVLLLLLVSLLHIPTMIAKLVVSIIVVILNYIFSKLFVFKKNKNADADK